MRLLGPEYRARGIVGSTKKRPKFLDRVIRFLRHAPERDPESVSDVPSPRAALST
jgi:hypothetical protein